MFICSRLEKKEASDCEKAFFLLKSKKKHVSEFPV